jgi:hypothetical protein
MIRNAWLLCAALACLAFGFVGIVSIGEQAAQADTTCNNRDRFSESCRIGTNVTCELMGETQCKTNNGYYAQENFWDNTPREGWHSPLLFQQEKCARVYNCVWDGQLCNKGLSEKIPVYQQIYGSSQCQQ